FEQKFGFRDYSIVTGHATAYLDTGWNDLMFTVSAGRYLAGDIGATFQVSRVFRSGVTLGAFFTRTNASALQFGEGTFDKGVYLSFPFDTILTRSSGSQAFFEWKPLTRDGGARLGRPDTLYGVTNARNPRALWYQPPPPPNESVIPSERRESWQPASRGPEPYASVPAKPSAAQWASNERFEHAL